MLQFFCAWKASSMDTWTILTGFLYGHLDNTHWVPLWTLGQYSLGSSMDTWTILTVFLYGHLDDTHWVPLWTLGQYSLGSSMDTWTKILTGFLYGHLDNTHWVPFMDTWTKYSLGSRQSGRPKSDNPNHQTSAQTWDPLSRRRCRIRWVEPHYQTYTSEENHRRILGLPFASSRRHRGHATNTACWPGFWKQPEEYKEQFNLIKPLYKIHILIWECSDGGM